MTYEEAYKKYRRRMESFCLYKLDGGDGQLAEDLCSEVFFVRLFVRHPFASFAFVFFIVACFMAKVNCGKIIYVHVTKPHLFDIY